MVRLMAMKDNGVKPSKPAKTFVTRQLLPFIKCFKDHFNSDQVSGFLSGIPKVPTHQTQARVFLQVPAGVDKASTTHIVHFVQLIVSVSVS